MSVNNVQIVISILLVVMEVCVQINSTPAFHRYNLSGHVKEDSDYSFSFLNFYDCCFLFKISEQYNPIVTDRQNNIRPARDSANTKGNAKDRKRLAPQVPFLTPFGNILKNVDQQLEHIILPQKFNIDWKLRQDKQFIKSFMQPHSLQVVKSTPISLVRKLRSTEIDREALTAAVPSPRNTITSTPLQIQASALTNNFLAQSSKSNNEKIRSSRKSMKSNTTGVPHLPTAEGRTTFDIPTGILGGEFVDVFPHKQQKYAHSLDQFERTFYSVTSGKLFSISPVDRRENGISFVESGLFLFLVLTALSAEVVTEVKSEINYCLGLHITDLEKMEMIRHVVNSLPVSSNELKFLWSSRLVVNGSWHPTNSLANALGLRIHHFNGNQSTEQLLETLNHMVEEDSGGAMRNTFEEDELSDGARAVLMQTIYLRARWRAAPVLLNGTRPFRDAGAAPARASRMLRVNDVMRYADLTEWDAQAVEIPYSTPGLSLLLLVPRGRSLRALAARAAASIVDQLAANMSTVRVAVTLPIYTLRMTLLLPNKLQDMGISELVSPKTSTATQDLRLSHGVQRVMFWAEAGRNAFKDDGIEWDHKSEIEMMVDRPYLFYVRWRNLTLMNGHFVL